MFGILFKTLRKIVKRAVIEEENFFEKAGVTSISELQEILFEFDQNIYKYNSNFDFFEQKYVQKEAYVWRYLNDNIKKDYPDLTPEEVRDLAKKWYSFYKTWLL